jgi:putative endonuclease
VADAARAYVYLLQCRDGTLYCGWTVDVEMRVAAHATGRASRYTARRLPVELAAAWEMESASAARRMEWRVKQLTRTEKLALVGGAALPTLTARPQ